MRRLYICKRVGTLLLSLSSEICLNLEKGENGPDVIFKAKVNHAVCLIQHQVTTYLKVHYSLL